MSTKKRILFITNEMSPFLELTSVADTVNKLAVMANDNNWEVRCIMPRFGVINERRHRLHEVVRLSGLNVSVANEDYPLTIKVASLPTARLQVYFLDNEDLFKRKSVFNDEDGSWFDDNALRVALFSKGAIETVKKFGWAPDIVHTAAWMSGLIPMYLKTVYKQEPVFSNAKIVTTVNENTFKDKLGADFFELASLNDNISNKNFEAFKEGNNFAMFKGAVTYADAVTVGAEKIDKKLQEQIAAIGNKPVINYNKEGDLTDYLDLYNDLTNF